MSKLANEMPSLESPRGFCTRCGYSAQFTSVAELQLNRFDRNIGTEYEQAVFLKCQGCNDVVITISYDTTRLPFGVVRGEPFFYYPPLGSRAIDDSIPEEIASCYEESQRCLSVAAYRATVVMCRNTIALFVNDQGSDEVKKQETLFQKLEVMAKEQPLQGLIADWAHLVRAEGNAGAHSEDYEPVSKEKAEEISEITKHILFLQYEVPAKVDRTKSTKTLKSSS